MLKTSVTLPPIIIEDHGSGEWVPTRTSFLYNRVISTSMIMRGRLIGKVASKFDTCIPGTNSTPVRFTMRSQRLGGIWKSEEDNSSETYLYSAIYRVYPCHSVYDKLVGAQLVWPMGIFFEWNFALLPVLLFKAYGRYKHMLLINSNLLWSEKPWCCLGLFNVCRVCNY